MARKPREKRKKIFIEDKQTADEDYNKFLSWDWLTYRKQGSMKENLQYVFRYRRHFFWRKLIIVGHEFQPRTKKMVVYFPDGSLREIKNWNDCEVRLGVDWVLVTERKIKEEAGR